MPTTLRRRALLAALGAVAVGGCTESGAPDEITSDEPTDGPTDDLPEACPVTQGYDVERPEDLSQETVRQFVEAYENVHYREAIVEYEPESRFSSYELSATVQNVRSVDDGYEVEVSGGGAVYRSSFLFGAHREESPDDAERVPAGEVDDEVLRDLLETAATEGEAEAHVHEAEELERYIDLFESLFDTYEPHTERGDSATLHFSVDGTPVEVDVQATNFHGDYWWSATYYVDDHVVYRAEEDGDPKDGELLECRTST